MGNQATKVIKKKLDEQQFDLLLVEPHNHHVNAAKRAIQTFKAHFISALATTNSKFPLQMWDQLTPQDESTLNMLHPSCINPDISADEAVHGPYNWNCFLLAPPGSKAVVYESPKTQDLWGSRDIDACCVCLSLDHYWCNHFFIPETQAYRISISAKLFPQHCQVPFLLWNEHLQEMTDELVTTLKELPGPKRSGVLDNIESRLEINDAQTTNRTLTSHTHEWLLPQGDLQRLPIVAHPEQRVEQRVTTVYHSDAMSLQCITEAPPINSA
jgi:hypothetical protein